MHVLLMVLLISKPWWPHLFTWPRFLDPISWWWLSVKGYALTSSWFNVAWIITAIAVLRHHNCNHRRCPAMRTYPHGHLKLCKKHHPKVPDHGRITQEHIDEVSADLTGTPQWDFAYASAQQSMRDNASRKRKVGQR